MRRSLDGLVTAVSLAGTAGAAVGAAVAATLGCDPRLVAFAAAGVGAATTLIAVRFGLRSLRRTTAALRDGIAGFKDGDYTLRLAATRDDELGDLMRIYNAVADALASERRDLRQRELLLATVLETTPTAVLLVNQADRVLLANRAARELFGAGNRLDGRGFEDVRAGVAEPMMSALAGAGDTIVTLAGDDGDETFVVSRHGFELNTRHHLLLLVRRITPEARRSEAAAWRKVLRVVGHEINNSLAPVRSLVRSARRLLEDGDAAGRVPDLLDTIDESAARLHRFVDGYRRVARLPAPHPETVELRSFVARIRELEPCALEGEVPACTVWFDAAQLQQVILNLLRNAREAGSPTDEVRLGVAVDVAGTLSLTVSDRGSGMDDATFSQALTPFYTTKPQGGGVGLALCREILEAHGGGLRLARRAAGGIRVVCTIPAAAPPTGA